MTHRSKVIQNQIPSITQLSPNSCVSKHRIQATVIARLGGRLEVFEPFGQTQQLSRCAKSLLDVLVGLNVQCRVVSPEEVPGVEAGEVLEGAEDLVAALWILH